ncbi:MAG: serine/threonine-protein kinase [Candidatus Eremiobacterota bacterium]
MDELKPGYKFKHAPYKIIEKVGQGGQCIVYRGKLGREEYAVKQLILSPEYDSFQEQYITMFKREYELLSVLAHPLLPKAYNCFREDGKYFIVVEFISGKNLLQIMEERKKPLPEDTAVELACLISELLVYLTSRQKPVILRDIKPANIIITEEGHVKFIDLTIARNYSPEKKDTMKLGSPGYAPPEQYRGESSVKSDVYSLGVTLHELLTLHDPSLNIHSLPPVKSLNGSVSDELCNIIQMATELKPEKRLSPEELSKQLKKRYNQDSSIKFVSPLTKLSNEIYGQKGKKLPLLTQVISRQTEKKIKIPSEKKHPEKHRRKKEHVVFYARYDPTDYITPLQLSIFFLCIICFFLLISGARGIILCLVPLLTLAISFCFITVKTDKNIEYIIGDMEFMEMKNFSVINRIPWDSITSFGYRISDNKYIVESMVEGNGKRIIFGKNVENWEKLKNIIEQRSSLPCMSIEDKNIYAGEN